MIAAHELARPRSRLLGDLKLTIVGVAREGEPGASFTDYDGELLGYEHSF